MTATNQYTGMAPIETALKRLDLMARKARAALLASDTLDEKRRFAALENTYKRARREIRKTYFDYEDITRLAEATDENSV